MSKKNTYVPTETTIDESGMVRVEATPVEVKPEIMENAFSIVKDKDQYIVVRIPFNFTTGFCGTPEHLQTHYSKTAAISAFKVTVAMSGLLT